MLSEVKPLEKAITMSAKEITSQRLRHYVRHIHISTDEHNLQRASQTLLAQPMQPAVDVAAVFVGDGVVGDADRRLVIGCTGSR